jgi:hypothetical protein
MWVFAVEPVIPVPKRRMIIEQVSINYSFICSNHMLSFCGFCLLASYVARYVLAISNELSPLSSTDPVKLSIILALGKRGGIHSLTSLPS